MPQKTMRIEKQTYFVHQAGYWKFLVKQDDNSDIYVPVCRKGWQDGGEVEIFSLLPPDGSGDELLLQIRIYTKANETDRVPPVSNPALSVEGLMPVFTFIEPEKQQVRVELMCILSLEGRRLRIMPLIKPEGF